MDRYEYKTYGMTEVFDERTGEWREPETPDEIEWARWVNKAVKRSMLPIEDGQKHS